MGHCLHHILTKVEYAPVSGINGVPWDVVEFPSQFLENWCWEKEVMPTISEHIHTGDSLPSEIIQRLLAIKNFQAAMRVARQLEFSLFDFRLHAEYKPEHPMDIQELLNQVRQKGRGCLAAEVIRGEAVRVWAGNLQALSRVQADQP